MLVAICEQVLWDDIGGEEKIKQQLREAVEWPLKYSEVCVCVHLVFAIN